MATISRAELQAIAARSGPASPIHALLKSVSGKKRKHTAPAEIPRSYGRTLSVVVPMVPNTANVASRKSRNFWSVRRERERYFAQLDELSRTPFLGSMTWEIPDGIDWPSSAPIGRASVTSTMYLGNRMDQDNAVARHKWLLDWLQNRGYLHNDRLLEWAAFPTQVVKRGQGYRIELVITEPAP